ncbi:MAG: hypothetical protein KME16_02390 [Scytolyngbya sp. HA4215-MV1]|jgi:hypothetical protein|nr:hypothetical protein [Scytolyngbya sp. HA4215-MV1]
MDKQTIYEIGDKVQAGDGRIGVVIDADRIPLHQSLLNAQKIVVRFPDQSTLEGMAENFKAVNDKPFGKVGS